MSAFNWVGTLEKKKALQKSIGGQFFLLHFELFIEFLKTWQSTSLIYKTNPEEIDMIKDKADVFNLPFAHGHSIRFFFFSFLFQSKSFFFLFLKQLAILSV